MFLFLKFQSHTDRLRQWVAMGIALLVLGIILHFSHGKKHINNSYDFHLHINYMLILLDKQLYTIHCSNSA